MNNWSTRSTCRLTTQGLVAGLCVLCGTALAQSPAEAIDRSPQAAASRGGQVGHGTGISHICTRLFDGRGEKVLVQQPGRDGSSSTRGCRADNPTPKPAEAVVPTPIKVAEPDKPVKPPLKRVATPSTAIAAPITAGAIQVEDALPRTRSASQPISTRLTAGRLSATLVTSGTAMFLLQSGLWTYLLILGLPLWQHVDLLPIVDSASGGDAESVDGAADTDAERAVTHVLEAMEPSAEREARSG